MFRAKKTMRVPVKERKEALENKASIEHWLKDPNESLGVVFDRNERLSEDEWKVFVASKKKIAFWELSPAFTLEILPDETEFGKQAFRGFDLMLCAFPIIQLTARFAEGHWCLMKVLLPLWR